MSLFFYYCSCTSWNLFDSVCVFVCMSFSVHMFSGSSECVQLVHFRNCKFFDGTTFRLIFCCFVSFNLQAIGEPKQIHELCPWPLFLHYHATWQTYFPFFFRSFSLSCNLSFALCTPISFNGHFQQPKIFGSNEKNKTQNAFRWMLKTFWGFVRRHCWIFSFRWLNVVSRNIAANKLYKAHPKLYSRKEWAL